MSTPTSYEIVLRGRPGTRLLQPFVDDFTIATGVEAEVGHPTDVVTRLIGDICDPAHLNGILAHLTSVNVEIISIAPRRIVRADHSPTGSAS